MAGSGQAKQLQKGVWTLGTRVLHGTSLTRLTTLRGANEKRLLCARSTSAGARLRPTNGGCKQGRQLSPHRPLSPLTFRELGRAASNDLGAHVSAELSPEQAVLNAGIKPCVVHR